MNFGEPFALSLLNDFLYCPRRAALGRRLVIKAYQARKQESLTHPLLEQNLRVAQLPFVQARILARHLRGDIADYLPFVPK